MKIGIITFWNSQDNYGQILQCFALQNKLIEYGNDVFLIKYNPKELNKIRKVKIFLYSIYKNILCRDKKKRIYRCIPEFRDKYINTTDIEYTSWNELNENPPQADCYICGSDQIWNPIDYPYNSVKPWFLDFGEMNTKRISYAASFGQLDLPQNLIDFIKPMLNRFDAISVREKSGINICAKAGITDVMCVLDPTFLVNKDVYLSMSEKPIWKNKFILGYFLNIKKDSSVLLENILEYTKKKSIPFKIVPSHGVESYIPVEDFYYPTIPQWLGVYNEAEEILTTSFHGVVFSIIFHKSFLVFLLNKDGERMNDRIFSLLEVLGLENRIYNPNSKIEGQMINEINWIAVDEKLEKLKHQSLNFLLKAIY